MYKKCCLISTLILFSSLVLLTHNLAAEDNNGIEIKFLTVEEANKLIDENKGNPDFVILDVRTRDEYGSGHIANALNVDYKSSNFNDSVSNLDREKTYLTYCRSGRRSTAASKIMAEIGFENIYMIDGGILAWNKANLPTNK